MTCNSGVNTHESVIELLCPSIFPNKKVVEYFFFALDVNTSRKNLRRVYQMTNPKLDKGLALPFSNWNLICCQKKGRSVNADFSTYHSWFQGLNGRRGTQDIILYRKLIKKILLISYDSDYNLQCNQDL